MFDLGLLRGDNSANTIELLKRKDPTLDVDRLIELDGNVRAINNEIEAARCKKNELARSAKGGVTEDIRSESIACGKKIKELQEQLEGVEKEFRSLYLSYPNILMPDVPQGGKESNQVVRTILDKPSFSFEPQPHTDLGSKPGWLEFEGGTRVAGSNFAAYGEHATMLMYALTRLMIKNNQEHGYRLTLPPTIISEKSLETTGNLPKFKDQVYAIPEDGYYLSPTAEVGLANMYRGHIFDVEDLPLRLTAWTSCFRREAGTYGSQERGLIRIHQFEKVELYTFCPPDQSSNELDRMITCAEDILKKLGLHYRVSLLAGQDCSFQSAKTYDIEVWLPGQKDYYEVSSCSNCTDFQARRGMMRYRQKAGDKPNLVHTLNGSSLALPRLMVAVMEAYQQADGSIALPDILNE